MGRSHDCLERSRLKSKRETEFGTGQRDMCVRACARTCECVSFQLGTFGHYRDKSENRKGGSIKQDEGKTTTVPLPVSEGGRKRQIF